MKRGTLLAALATAALLAGCGGGERTPEEKVESALDALGELPVVGLGEAGPVEVSTAGWRTDFSKALVPLSEFRPGGPGKDGIPAIDRPRFAPARVVANVKPGEPVIELAVEGEARAYPLQVLVWHEIVNDEVGGVPVAVTYCPLCRTAIAFDRRVDGRILSFGVTGNLRDSDLVMYDRQTESWWQQFGGEALVGAYAGTELEQVPARIVSFEDFSSRHPDGLVLTRETGYDRPYGRNPYPGYDDVSSGPWFSARNEDDDRLLPKEVVVFVEHGGESAAVPRAVLSKRGRLELELGGARIVLSMRDGTVEALADGRPVVFSEPFWFAVAAFRPDVRVLR